MDTKPESVEAYVAAQNPAALDFLTRLRARVSELVPGSGEAISYKILAFTVDGKVMFYAAGWANHVSCYPIPETDPQLTEDLQPYIAGKGTVKFPLGPQIPWDLVDRIVLASAVRLRA